MKQLLLLGLFIFCFQIGAKATGEPSTYFNIFVPPNNDAVQRNACLIVTALFDSTYVDIVDDDMDGDNDDNFQGYLMAGQSYILYIKDNGINDDAMYASGGVLKQDGDYFIINADKAVYASQSTNSDWQHDWVPSTNRTSKGKKFIIYSPPTSNSPRDLNTFAYEDSTVITVRKISFQNTTGTGLTNVDPNAQDVVYQQMINIGEDIIFNYTGGRDLLASGETYIVESNKDITVQYGALWTNSRDGGGYVPSENGSSSGNTFYFGVPYQANYEQEVRIVSWDMANAVSLSYYANGVWNNLGNWTLDALESGDWVGNSVPVNVPYVFKVECSAGKKVSVFEANWMETGSPGTSDMATMVSSAAGSTAGKDFLVYMTPPGNEQNVLNPFTGNNFGGRFTHIYLFARDTANVTVKDAFTNGNDFSKTYTILPGRYVDCYLSEQEWKGIYNGDGNPNSGPERPYLRVASDQNISVMNTNFNDNWMMYFGSSQGKSFDQNSSASATDAAPGESIVISSQVDFKNADSIANVQVEVIVSSGAIPTKSNLINQTLSDSLAGNITTLPEKSIIDFENEPTLSSDYQYTIDTEIEMQVNYLDGNPVPNNTVINIETIVTGEIDGVEEQSISSEGVQNKSADVSQLLFAENNQWVITQASENTWTANWVDVDGDNDDDLFLTTYESGQPNQLFLNNGNGFTSAQAQRLTTVQNGVVAATWADVDNDGDRDCFVASNQGKNQLLMNDGNLNFSAVQNSPVVTDGGYNHGASLADYNNDGLLDLFVLDFMPTAFNKLYKQTSGNSFEAVNNLTPALATGRSIGATWADYDNDGDQDLFVPQGNGENNAFYINQGDGSFVQNTTLIITQDGSNSVASAWGDFNNDGFLDLFVSNSSNQPNLLYQNDGQGGFILISDQDPVLDLGNSHGCSWADVDNNGYLDLYVSNDQGQEKYLYLNDQGVLTKEKNEVITTATGNTFGHYWSDFDQDGDLDLYVCHHGQEKNTFYTNQGSVANHWLEIKMKGTVSNASGIGARVKIKANGIWQTREVNAQSGLGGQHSLLQHFGLGNATVVDSIEVRWPSGIVEYRTNITADQKMTIVESNQALISGKVYSDDNNNCTADTLERGVAGTKVFIANLGLITVSDQEGIYELWVEPGTYTIQQEDAMYWEGTNCITQTVNITSNNQVVQDIDFANTKTSVGVDLSLTYNLTALRRGFTNESAVVVQNLGTEDLDEPANVQITFPAEVIPLSASPMWVNSNNNTYTWSLETLERGASFRIQIQDSVDVYSILGSEAEFSGNVTVLNAELNPADNSFAKSETIVGAIDPNDMIVFPKGAGTRGLVSAEQPLQYKVRFQNVGTYAARDVQVTSFIPKGTDISSFEMLEASHEYRMVVKDRVIQWDFNNINLPDSATNESESHGYILFTVKPESHVEPGTVIRNKSEIVFDYEVPIATNTVINTIYDNTIKGENDIKVFPNPAKNNLYVIPQGAFEINAVKMLDGVGREVPVLITSDNTLLRVDWGAVEKGVYFIVLNCSDRVRRTTKVIVQ